MVAVIRPGTVIGDRFELLARTGEGGMGSVYRAHDRATGAEVAVKLVSVAGKDGRARFDREASLLAQLHHPNVVDYIAHGATPDGAQFLAQEWVDGTTLSAQLVTLGATAREIVTIALGVADALAATHAQGILHRDIKPSNIILARGSPERIKLVDFGIARLAGQVSVVTLTGGVIGTPSYMSPEQARGSGNLAPAVDVWALGCVLYEGLTGQTAFAGSSPTAIRLKVVLSEPGSVAALCPEAPAPLVALVHRMLSKAEDDRPASGRDVAAALRALPAIPDGPRRRVGADLPTLVVPMTERGADELEPSCYAMFACKPGARLADPRDQLVAIASSHAMELHLLDDGSALLISRARGKPGALAASRAAIELRARFADGAVCVFAHMSGEALEEAIERGAAMLQRAMMATLFGGVVAGVTGGSVHLDDVIADLIVDELAVAHTRGGPVLGAVRQAGAE